MRFVRELHLDLRKAEQSQAVRFDCYQVLGLFKLTGFHLKLSFLHKFGFSTCDDSRLVLSVISANDGQIRIPFSVSKLEFTFMKNVELKSIRRDHELLSSGNRKIWQRFEVASAVLPGQDRATHPRPSAHELV
jgi:hypothetical protein